MASKKQLWNSEDSRIVRDAVRHALKQNQSTAEVQRYLESKFPERSPGSIQGNINRQKSILRGHFKPKRGF